jgi:hypothetical protein
MDELATQSVIEEQASERNNALKNEGRANERRPGQQPLDDESNLGPS